VLKQRRRNLTVLHGCLSDDLAPRVCGRDRTPVRS
jgi:hypothetical protein